MKCGKYRKELGLDLPVQTLNSVHAVPSMYLCIPGKGTAPISTYPTHSNRQRQHTGHGIPTLPNKALAKA